jgi:prepilin-type N-terminal cleavage/methylation domain-containing protein
MGVPCPILMRWQNECRRGFTLIELLLVVAIIGVLAALIAAATGSSNLKAKIAMTQAELGEMESAIQEYHDKLGFYPPDNPVDPAMNPLWFELLGTTNNGATYVALDGSGQISLADLNAKFDRQGFANTGLKAHSTDESGAPISFLSHLRSEQTGQPDAGKPQIKILVCSVASPVGSGPITGTSLNPWHYVSSHPTNNASSYDLWADLVIGGKTYQVNNWSKP